MGPRSTLWDEPTSAQVIGGRVKDVRFLAGTVENELDEAVNDSALPQMPVGFVIRLPEIGWCCGLCRAAEDRNDRAGGHFTAQAEGPRE
jgi:hypothetical protein